MLFSLFIVYVLMEITIGVRAGEGRKGRGG